MPEQRTLRGQALHKLASLSSVSSLTAQDKDFARLCDAYNAPPNPKSLLNGHHTAPQATAAVPMSLRELEVLFALCDAAPFVHSLSNANRLLHQLCPYVSESCCQALAPSPFLKDLKSSPWEILTFKLVNAITKIGSQHPSLREKSVSTLAAYVNTAQRLASQLAGRVALEGGPYANGHHHSDALRAVTLAASLAGHLKAAFHNACFWTQGEQNDLILGLQSILSNKFLLSVEAALSSIRIWRGEAVDVNTWKQYIKHYAAEGRPLGAMLLQQGLMKVVRACASLLVTSQADLDGLNILHQLMSPASPLSEGKLAFRSADVALVETVAGLAAREVISLDEGSDYLRLGSGTQQLLAHSVKADSLVSFLCCSLVSEEIADLQILTTWLETSLADTVQSSEESLACTVLKCMAVLSTTSDRTASSMCRLILRFLGRAPTTVAIGSVAAESLLYVLKRLPQDTTITTLYSLANELSVNKSTDAQGRYALFTHDSFETRNQAERKDDVRANRPSNLPASTALPSWSAYNTIIMTIVAVAKGFNDEKIAALALSMLVQKVGRVSVAVDLKIITEAAVLAAEGGSADFRSLLRLYMRLHQDGTSRKDHSVIQAVAAARNYLSMTLKGGSKLYEIYLHHVLETIISMGEVPMLTRNQPTDVEFAAREMAILLQPLALLVSSNVETPGIEGIESFSNLQRDAWYNLVVHGISSNSRLGKRNLTELQILARYCHPLITEELAERLESDVELNTVLRRGMSSENTTRQKREMCELLPQCEAEIKSLEYPQLIFLKAVHLVENMRADTGHCTVILTYFVDFQLRETSLGSCVAAIAMRSVDTYLSNTLQGDQEQFSTPYVAQQLSFIFEGCCHRVDAVQRVSYSCAERILSQVPSALCQRTSLFALLDLLTILWTSCLEADTEDYEWKPFHRSSNGATKLQLSDNYSFRRQTLRTFHRRAKDWVVKAINIAPLDVKGLLQTYLSQYVDEEAFGHMSLGRSFAFSMGAIIPTTDQRLSAIETEDELQINTASDFMAQYTTRQEYRLVDTLQIGGARESTWQVNDLASATAQTAMVDAIRVVEDLVQLESSLSKNKLVPSGNLRDSLRQAASLLCRSTADQSSLLSHFVRIPFLLFSKQIMNFGLSLWMGVIKENPRMEPRILVEITEGWIITVRGRLGIFSKKLSHIDPFFLKEEFAPSDKEATLKQQERTRDLIAPSFRVLQFLSSHYAATRLTSRATEKAYLRLLKVSLLAIRDTSSHPLSREVHFHIILLGLKILRNNISLDRAAQWRLKDDLLCAGLAWFNKPPRWSFGGNRLQVKAETHLLADVAMALANVSNIGTTGTPQDLPNLKQKQDLLRMLVSDEQTRLMVWLFPLDHARKHHFTSGQHGPVDINSLSALVSTAWTEMPAIAVQLVSRFQDQAVTFEVRRHLLNSPALALDEPDALHILLGQSIPNDVSSQLKYLIYWAPVNPITAVTYFLPAYGNHPFIVQYSVRALESHSVDVTFFYVPQIVQSLRYDVLGYVQRYIIETAKFSQLFAHQIIWNMKANAFKDEDASDPDPVKPTLDKVMDSLISSFSSADKEFYEREFSFFNEITSISGKLRPFIKKSKPEKKQIIEEELRKVQVDVGVYLPCNPDGVVIGIDRKSGKPLQSHAKAPFMATFRIRKEKQGDEGNAKDQLNRLETSDMDQEPADSVDVWQSAIFKVGDDCRQDVLALQMIAAFRGIFHFVGLPVFVYPYRVTATAPGCGVIDVLPASISRDMLGREAVNGLYDWFTSKFGSEDAPAFQVARANFVKSLAAYSIISYLLQFKDRHNGNIMFDDQGHILHIDFGFCFDIVPGGVKFERAPFKLTKEMVAVMGGSAETQSFRWFEELCVKAFLASRPFFATLSHIVVCMLDSGLPCFKPETIEHFKQRFVLDKTDGEAAEYVKVLVHKSYNHYSTHVYDQFQLVTNGIPY